MRGGRGPAYERAKWTPPYEHSGIPASSRLAALSPHNMSSQAGVASSSFGFDPITTASGTVVFETPTVSALPFTVLSSVVVADTGVPQGSGSFATSTATSVASQPGDVQEDHKSGLNLQVAIPLIVLPAVLILLSSVAFVMWSRSRRAQKQRPAAGVGYVRTDDDLEKDMKATFSPKVATGEGERESDAHSFVSDGTTLAPSLRY